MQTSILVIEDDPRMASLIERGLLDFGYHVTVVNDGTEGYTLATVKHFDLIITDIMLPGLSGLELCKRIKQINNKYPIIMLTALGTTDDKVVGFDAGADDYMVKPFEIRELNARITALLKRASLQPNDNVLKFADLTLNLETKLVKRGDTELNLTPKEFNLLTYMMLNPGRVLSKSEIAEKVWDTHFDTGTNFIEVYVSYLRRKVDKEFEKKLIHTKSGMGFILKEIYEDKD